MDRDELRRHIDSAAPGRRADSRRIAWLILSVFWSEEPEGLTEREALDWSRRRDPQRIEAALPACSCSTGLCLVCN
jgi:hypothetical protein